MASTAPAKRPSIVAPRAAPVLAETKLRVPATRADAIQRAELVGLLIAGTESRLTLLGAPAGWGKTSLLGAWHADRRERRPFAWISLDSADNDPVRFWDGVVAALQTVVPSIGVEAKAALHSPGTTVGDHALPLLINELAVLSEPLVLVLDDYHLIANESIHRGVELLVARLPATVRLVIATRSDPPLPLGRLRAGAQLTEIRASDLRFSVNEAETFLNRVLGLDLDAAEVAQLHERTEGWVAGLQLAGLSLRGRTDRRAFIESFAGDDSHIVDYLGFEVLDQQPGPVRDFMLSSSILDRLSAPLCAAVTEAEDAGRLLDELERANLFVVALDSKREWYRYHHLFAELLRHELGRTRANLVPELHRRAAAWYRAEGAIQEAIEHVTAAGDLADAIELITNHWYEFLQRGCLETVAAWIDLLPAFSVTQEPHLCLTRAWLGVNTGRMDEVDRWIEAADRVAPEPSDAEELPPVASGVASLRAISSYMAGDVSAAVEAGRHALDLERGGPASPWRPVGCPVLGLSLHWRGQADDAQSTLTEAVGLAKRNGNHLAAMHARGGLAAIAYERGDVEAAADHATQARALAEEHSLADHWARSLSLCVEGQLLDLQGKPDEADRAISRALELAGRGVASVEIAYALMALADVRYKGGGHEEARALSKLARKAVRECSDPGILSEQLARVDRHLKLTPRAAQRVEEPQALSEAELAVLRLLRGEMSQREIGGELFISVNTVKTHTRNIYRKLSVVTRDEAVHRAKSLGLL